MARNNGELEDYLIRISQLEEQVQTLSRRNDEMKAENHKLKITAEQAERAHEKAVIDSKLRAAAVHAGVRPGADDDVIGAAHRDGRQWVLESNGDVVLRQDGATVSKVSGSKASSLTPLEWVEKFHKPDNLAYYRDGAESAVNAAGASKENPWSIEHWNMTRQAEIMGDKNGGVEKAKRLAAEAGVPVESTYQQAQAAQAKRSGTSGKPTPLTPGMPGSGFLFRGEA